jgi:hypothetical protein
VKAVEVLAAKVVSPWYAAVIECALAVNVEVENVAWPALSVPVPMLVAPSRNATVPVIVPAEVLVTVAVNVTVWPAVEGFTEEARTVVVAGLAGLFTVCVKAIEVLGANVASPE